jgi:hypothetical protein
MNAKHEAVKISDMTLKTQIVPGKNFKLTLSNAESEIRCKIPETSTIGLSAEVGNAVRAFTNLYKDYPVEFSLRGTILVSDASIKIVVSSKSGPDVLTLEVPKS